MKRLLYKLKLVLAAPLLAIAFALSFVAMVVNWITEGIGWLLLTPAILSFAAAEKIAGRIL